MSGVSRENLATPFWERTIHQHGPSVFGICWRILGDPKGVEAVFRQVFLDASAIHAEKEVKKWPVLLQRLATQNSLNHLRGRALVSSVGAGDDDSQVQVPPDPLVDRMRRALARLPAPAAEAFCLKHFEGLSNARVAAVLGIGIAAVAAALRESKTILAESLAGAAEEESK